MKNRRFFFEDLKIFCIFAIGNTDGYDSKRTNKRVDFQVARAEEDNPSGCRSPSNWKDDSGETTLGEGFDAVTLLQRRRCHS